MTRSPGRLRRALARRAGIRFFRFFSRDLGERAASAAPPQAGLRQLSESAVLELCADAQLELRADAVRQAYSRGDLCVGAFRDGALTGYCWLAFAPLPHLDGVWVRFGPSTAWIYKSFVRPSHRGQGIAPALYDFVDGVGAARGRRYSVICVESHNEPSIRAALRAGYRSAGHGGYVVKGLPALSWCTPAARKHGVAFFLPGTPAA